MQLESNSSQVISQVNAIYMLKGKEKVLQKTTNIINMGVVAIQEVMQLAGDLGILGVNKRPFI